MIFMMILFATPGSELLHLPTKDPAIRYCDPKMRKTVVASKEVLKLYGSEEGRNLP